jgi:tRNA (mo5U34)-methyltransferase
MGLLSRIPRPGAGALRAEANEIIWFHSLNLGKGVVTQGVKSRMRLAYELRALRLPNLRGLTVLDIGAWDGYFSFAAERKGAKHVVALDHYAWSMDIQAQRAYIMSCVSQGLSPEPFEQVPEVWRPDELPGKRGFDLAHRCYGSSVEAVVGDFMTMDLSSLGRFDVVFFLGVLYHMQGSLPSPPAPRERD